MSQKVPSSDQATVLHKETNIPVRRQELTGLIEYSHKTNRVSYSDKPKGKEIQGKNGLNTPLILENHLRTMKNTLNVLHGFQS